MVYTFEIIGMIFILIMIYFSYSEYKKKIISQFSFFFWLILWILGFLLIIFHPVVNKLLDPLNIIRVLDLYMILSFIFLFSLVFYLFLKNKINERKIEDLTRGLSLKDLENGKNENQN